MGETEQILDSLAARCAATEAELSDLKARVAAAQELANMGDYDWDIVANTNRWSDQLYRIYGLEPQSLNMSYEEFMSRVHPDDREMLLAWAEKKGADGTKGGDAAAFGGAKYQTLEDTKRHATLAAILPWLRGQVSKEKRFIGTVSDWDVAEYLDVLP